MWQGRWQDLICCSLASYHHTFSCPTMTTTSYWKETLLVSHGMVMEKFLQKVYMYIWAQQPTYAQLLQQQANGKRERDPRPHCLTWHSMVVEKFLQKVYIYGHNNPCEKSFMYVLTTSVVAARNWTNMAFCLPKANPPRVQRDIHNFLSTHSSWPRTTTDSLLPYATNWIESPFCVFRKRWGNNLHTTLDISVDVGREAHILGVGVDLLS